MNFRKFALTKSKPTRKLKYAKCKLYPRAFSIFLPNVIKIDPYNFYAFSETCCSIFSPVSAVDQRYKYLLNNDITHQQKNNKVIENRVTEVENTDSSVLSVFFGRYSVFFGICNTDVGVSI